MPTTLDSLKGFCFIALLTLLSYALSLLPFFKNLHISPLIIGVILGVFLAPLRQKCPQIRQIIPLDFAIAFSAKALLRLGIVLYGFNISLLELQKVGALGVVLSALVVVTVLVFGVWLGVKVLKMERDLAILVSAGSAICGAAAVLAMESAIKAQPEKSVVAVGCVVVFGLFGMCAFPLIYLAGFLPFTPTQQGIFTGLSLHEVANVIAAGSAVGEESARFAIIIKMLRVILLVPVLFVVPFVLSRLPSPSNAGAGASSKLHIPWFALWFLACIVLNSAILLPPWLLDFLRLFCVLCLSAAMVALGLSVNLASFVKNSKDTLALGAVLFVLLCGLGFALVWGSARLGWL